MRSAPVWILVALIVVVAAWLIAHDHPAPDSSRREEVGEYQGDGRYVGPARVRATTPNLILIVIDTLRADCLGAGPDAPGDMPYLSRLARTGMRCTNVSTSAPATYPSLTSLLTGLLPDKHTVDHTPSPPMLPTSITTYAEALARGHGYDTAAFMQVHLSNGPDGPLQGFQTVQAAAPLHAWRGAIEE